MINFPIMTRAVVDMQNKNNFGLIEYFDNIGKNKFGKIKNKIDLIELLANEIPIKKKEINLNKDSENPNNEEKISLDEKIFQKKKSNLEILLKNSIK